MTSSGPIVRTPNDFYYHKLCALVQTGTESDLQPYLTPPVCNTGIYHLYTLDSNIYLEHIDSGATTQLRYENGRWITKSFSTENATYLGPYVSVTAIYDTHPELFI